MEIETEKVNVEDLKKGDLVIGYKNSCVWFIESVHTTFLHNHKIGYNTTNVYNTIDGYNKIEELKERSPTRRRIVFKK